MVLTAQLLPCEQPAIFADRDGPGRVVMRISIRSAFPHIIAALQADLHAFFQELFKGEPVHKLSGEEPDIMGHEAVQASNSDCTAWGCHTSKCSLLFSSCAFVTAGTVTMGLMADSMPVVGVGMHERQHSHIAALAQLYLPHSSALEQANGVPLIEQDPGSADEQAIGEEDAVMQEWQRIRMARVH